MKKIYLLIFLTVLIVSCENTEQESKSTDPETAQAEMTNAINPEDYSLMIPSDHEMYKAGSFEELSDLFLHTSEDKAYSSELKNTMLVFLFEDNLLEKLTFKEKLVYANEMASMKTAVVNIENFTDLIVDLDQNSNVKDDELYEIAQRFYDRNMKVLNSITWKEVDPIKNEKYEAMARLRQVFRS